MVVNIFPSMNNCNVLQYIVLCLITVQNYEPNFSCQFEKRVGIPMNG